MLFDKVPTISASELQNMINNHDKLNIIDVREPNEFSSGHIPGAVNVPLGSIDSHKWDKDVQYYTVCHSGRRSKMAAKQLIKMGYNATSMSGGMMAWNGQISYARM